MRGVSLGVGGGGGETVYDKTQAADLQTCTPVSLSLMIMVTRCIPNNAASNLHVCNLRNICHTPVERKKGLLNLIENSCNEALVHLKAH